mmetsp:Transcript_94049/g.265597  ORF Transcript_94049/g.265597 Transcript_94049/m.265597 type:complete len:96 (+) Transcript_94049:3-290(+)
MVFGRTLIRMAERADVHPALKKLWKKHYKVDGMVSQHLSPFEQNIVSPMMKDMPAKILNKSKKFLLEAGPAIGLGIFIYYWAEHEYHRIAYDNRS